MECVVGERVLDGVGSGCSTLAATIDLSSMCVLWLGWCWWFELSRIEGRFDLSSFATSISFLSSFTGRAGTVSKSCWRFNGSGGWSWWFKVKANGFSSWRLLGGVGGRMVFVSTLSVGATTGSVVGVGLSTWVVGASFSTWASMGLMQGR
jgi:hypothetical protein